MSIKSKLRIALGLFVFALGGVPVQGTADVPNIRLTDDPGSSVRPRVALDNQGNVLVVWQDNRFGNDEILWQKFTQTGAPLIAPIRVTNTAAASRNPDIASDGTGNSHIVWQEGEDVNGEGTVYWCRLDAAGVKILQDQQVPGGGLSGFARISVLSDGTTDLVWQRFAGTDQDVRHRRFDPTGVPICSERQFTEFASSYPKLPVICHNSANEAEIFRRELVQGTWRLRYAKIGTSPNCQLLQNVSIYNCNLIEPATDFAGNALYIISSCNGNILNHLGINNACQISQGSGTSTHPAVGADINSRAYATWRDVRDGNSEIYLCGFFGCSNLTGDIRLTTDPSSSEEPDIAVEESGTGNWVVVWRDARDGNNEIYLASAVTSDCVVPLPLATCRSLDSGLLFGARWTSDASDIPPGIPFFFDQTSVQLTKSSGDHFYLSGAIDSQANWICDDRVYVNGTDVEVGFSGIIDPSLPLCRPIEDVLAPVPAREVTHLIPWGTSCVEFKLADTQRGIYGNTALYLYKEQGVCEPRCQGCQEPCPPDGINDWFVPYPIDQPGPPANPDTHFDIVICSDAEMREPWLSELQADTDRINDEFRALPVMTPDLEDKVTFWLCVRPINMHDQQAWFELLCQAKCRGLDAILVRVPRCREAGYCQHGCDCTQPLGNALPIAIIHTDPETNPIPALHELGHAAFGLADEYQKWSFACDPRALDCYYEGFLCKDRMNNRRLGTEIPNVWRRGQDCEDAKDQYGFTASCWEFCEYGGFGCPEGMWRLGVENENVNLMRATCEDPESDTYGQAGDERLRQCLQDPIRCGEPGQVGAASGSQQAPFARTLQLHLRLGPSQGYADSIRITQGAPEQKIPAATAVFAEILDHADSVRSVVGFWDPRYVSLHDSLPSNTEVSLTLPIGHGAGHHWRVLNNENVVMAQGSLGAAFVKYCNRINYADGDCFAPDIDDDDVPDIFDNCPEISNPDQLDADGDGFGDACKPVSVDELPSGSPLHSAISAAPNPFNSSVTIRYVLPERSHVRVAVYDATGRQIRLVRAGPEIAGEHELVWDGKNDHGDPVSASVYFVALKTERETRVSRVVLLR